MTWWREDPDAEFKELTRFLQKRTKSTDESVNNRSKLWNKQNKTMAVEK